MTTVYLVCVETDTTETKTNIFGERHYIENCVAVTLSEQEADDLVHIYNAQRKEGDHSDYFVSKKYIK